MSSVAAKPVAKITTCAAMVAHNPLLVDSKCHQPAISETGVHKILGWNDITIFFRAGISLNYA